MQTVLITGANRGLGLEFVRQYKADGWKIYACCRQVASATALTALADHRLEVLALDVADPQSVQALAERLAGVSLDLLINNAGIYGPKGMELGSLDYTAWLEVFAINTLGPLRVVEALLPQLKQGTPGVICSVTSKMGSIGDNGSGGSYLYRSAKAALNAAHKSLALDLAGDGVLCAVLHPGWVRTDMGGPNGLIDAPESVAGMREVIANLGPEQSGGFFNYDGAVIPW